MNISLLSVQEKRLKQRKTRIFSAFFKLGRKNKKEVVRKKKINEREQKEHKKP